MWEVEGKSEDKGNALSQYNGLVIVVVVILEEYLKKKIQ